MESKHMGGEMWDKITNQLQNFLRLHRWSLGMDKLFHLTPNIGRDYFSMLGL